ncbi:MAG: hypothetical protein IT378_10705 [Sandaracinaceae bacterium]|nr:hypothetical protein [Sandaracinaceae bacterium]
MTALLFSMVCDYCEGHGLKIQGRGFVVWLDRPPGSEQYVFKTRADAERWRRHQQVEGAPIRAVLTESTFRWRRSSGSITDVDLADHLFEIFPDHRFEPGPFRAFLAPDDGEAAAA